MAPKDLIDHEQEDAANHETPRHTRGRRSNLIAKLNSIMLPPAAAVGGARETVEG